MIAVHRCPTRRADFCPHPLTATQQRVAAPTAVRGAGLPGDAEATLAGQKASVCLRVSRPPCAPRTTVIAGSESGLPSTLVRWRVAHFGSDGSDCERRRRTPRLMTGNLKGALSATASAAHSARSPAGESAATPALRAAEQADFRLQTRKGRFRHCGDTGLPKPRPCTPSLSSGPGGHRRLG